MMTKPSSSDSLNRRRALGLLSPYLWVVGLTGIAILLVGVAVLQYRWNSQIRRATEVKLGADLESVMLRWDLNLYREISTICIALQVGPDSGAHAHWSDYLHRYEQWRNGTDSGTIRNIYSNPYIVSDIYVFETSRGPGASLLRLDPDSDKIDATGRPSDLQHLLDRLEKRSTNLKTGLRAWETENAYGTDGTAETASPEKPKARTNMVTGWQFDEKVPAVVHPIVHHQSGVSSANSRVDWLVIVLNTDAITNRILPELTQRYFEGNRWSDYDVAVISVGKTSRLLYSSSPELGVASVNGPDSVMNIFGPPPESTEGSFWQVVKNRESLRGDEWRNFSGPVWFPVFENGADTQRWMLFLKHRRGSVEASITKVWRANLVIGASLLLLLAITMLLLITATRRVHTLAAMQMDFVASISHELRTPLAAMLCAGQNLSDGIARDLSEYGGLITAQAHQLIDLVDQILLFVAVRNGKRSFDLKRVSIGDVVENLRKTNFAILRKAGFEIECRIPENLPGVLADEQAVLRCLRNLIENAAKYSGKSRWIGLFAELDESGDRDSEIRISVVDHGMGIAASELTHIFDPFYRSRAAAAAQIHGNGLGLSIVKHIVQELGGRVTVNSDPNLGSSFTLHLKAATELRSDNDVGSKSIVLAK